ncbi:MAG: hypothetical protein HZC41_17985 [Chloroflexi bacterium]|nr:hypothetical protein [Chloroflexota bacterium]
MTRLPEIHRSLFLEGPAGSGKSTAASQYLRQVLADQQAAPESVLVLVPHPALSAPYAQVLNTLALPYAPHVITVSGFARLALRPFWPVVVKELGLNPALTAPTFLSADLAQYHLGRILQPYWEIGAFDSIRLPRYRVIGQILDTINNATQAGFSLDETESRLIAAWGERHSSRVTVYRTAAEIARRYQTYCLQHGLLDFALQLHLLVNILVDNPEFQYSFSGQFQYLIADNVEEMGALVHDFIFWCLETVPKTLLICDHDGGFRSFQGADPANALLLRDVCLQRVVFDDLIGQTEPIKSLVAAVAASPTPADVVPQPATPAVQFTSTTFYPQMIESCVQQVQQLVLKQQVKPAQITIVAPYLHDVLLFALQSRLQQLQIPSIYYRPSRPLKGEPVIQMLLTLLQLAATEIRTPAEIAQALELAIDGLDPVRASLLAHAVHRPEGLLAYETLPPVMQERITLPIGLRYNRLRQWLADHPVAGQPPDRFFAQLLEEVLTQPGYGLFENVSADSTVAGFLNAAEGFCRTFAGDTVDQTQAFLQFVREGFVTSDWEVERPDAVLIATAHTVLTRDLASDYQFWLDAGDSGWFERIEQPLTHPFVLRRGTPPDTVWTDDMEDALQTTTLRHLILGLLRRCRKGLFVHACDISANGYEQRGQLLLWLHLAVPALQESA